MCGEYNYDDPDRYGFGRKRWSVPWNDCVFCVQIRRIQQSRHDVSKVRPYPPGLRTIKKYNKYNHTEKTKPPEAMVLMGGFILAPFESGQALPLQKTVQVA